MTYDRARPWLVALLIGVLAGALVFAGCATGGTDFDDDDDAAGGGGTGGTSATGGGEFPCGVDCSAIITDQCSMGVCDEITGTCAVVESPVGTECDDGFFCTVGDSCAAGICNPGLPNTCGMDPEPCEVVTCLEATQSCTLTLGVDGTDCQPDNLCLINGSCLNGLCIGDERSCIYAPVPDDCHVAECNPTNGQCEPVVGNDGATCTDPNAPCQVNGTCNAGTCENTELKSCGHLTQPFSCTIGVCDTATGDCEPQGLNDGDSCDDLNPCTSSETCQGGQCVGGSTVNTCGPVDNCCLAICNEGNDADCVLDILLMGESVSAADWNAYRSALSAAGVTWTELNLDSADYPDAATLAPYNALIWFDESSSSATDAEAQVVADWLASGDKALFITSIDLMWDFQSGATGAGMRNLYDMWGATYMGDDSDSYSGRIATLDGVAGDPVTGDFAPPNGLLLTQSYDSQGDYVNETFGPATSSALYAAGGTGTGHAGLTRLNTGAYKVVWLGINFHNGLSSATQQAQLIKNVLDFFKT
jgi:hypothetical protein